MFVCDQLEGPPLSALAPPSFYQLLILFLLILFSRLGRSSEKLFLTAKDKLLEGDMEAAYVLFMRYLEVVKAIQDSKEFKTNKVLICTQLSAVLLVCVCVCVCARARHVCACIHIQPYLAVLLFVFVYFLFIVACPYQKVYGKLVDGSRLIQALNEAEKLSAKLQERLMF